MSDRLMMTRCHRAVEMMVRLLLPTTEQHSHTRLGGDTNKHVGNRRRNYAEVVVVVVVVVAVLVAEGRLINIS